MGSLKRTDNGHKADNDVKQTLSEKIYLQLRRAIIEQSIPCGKQITLQELKDRFGVSHTPIREALTKLSEEGLVDYYSNRGVRVVSFTEEDISNLFQFSSELDALAVAYCSRLPMTSILISELEESMTLSDELLRSGQLDEWEGASEDFHLLFLNYADNHYLSEACDKIHAKIALLGSLYNQTLENARQVQEAHRSIMNAFAGGNYDRAIQLMREHGTNDMMLALKAFRQTLARQA